MVGMECMLMTGGLALLGIMGEACCIRVVIFMPLCVVACKSKGISIDEFLSCISRQHCTLSLNSTKHPIFSYSNIFHFIFITLP